MFRVTDGYCESSETKMQFVLQGNKTKFPLYLRILLIYTVFHFSQTSFDLYSESYP